MKRNKGNQEQALYDIYKNVRTPDTVQNRLEETICSLKQANCTNQKIFTQSRRKKALSFRRAAVIAAAAVLAVGGTVFAAGRIYQMQLKKEKKYQTSIHISTEKALPDKVAEVELKVNYLPKGFSTDADKGLDYYYTNPAVEDTGYYIEGPFLIDEAEPLTEAFVKDAQTLTVNGHDAVYLSSSYTEDTDWKNEKVYLVYEEVNRILSVNAWGHADKEELMKIAENITLTPTENMVSSRKLTHWSEIIQPEKDMTENDSVENYPDEASTAEMANVHQIGDKFPATSSVDAFENEIQLEASVTDVQVADDLSPLTCDKAIPDEWKTLIGENGKLTPDTLKYVKYGDGVNTLPETLRTESSPVKLVYATIAYTNPGKKAIKDAWFMASPIPIVKEGDTYKQYSRTDDTCDEILNECARPYGEMPYADIDGSCSLKNYIPEIKPGESVTVHAAWLVNEDELDKLYLDLTGDGIFTENGLKIGYVELKLK